MSDTAEILKAHAPEFLALDEAEQKATPRPHLLPPATKKMAQVVSDMNDPDNLRTVAFFNEEEGPDSKFFVEARNKTRALLDAHAQALLRLAEREWRPISTAPRDGLAPGEGTLVDLWSCSQGRVANCFFDKADHKWVQRIYYYSPGKRLTQFREVTDVTHWQPLPKPPEVKP